MLLTITPRDIRFRHRPFPERPQVLAVAQIRYGALTIRGARIVRHRSGRVQLQMPNRGRMVRCACGSHNRCLDRFCPNCGKRVVIEASSRRYRRPRHAYVAFAGAEVKREFERIVLRAWEAETRPRLGAVA